MPSRRRVRLLAAVLVFVVVAIVYTRRAPIEQYKDYVTENVVGGGAVLRGGEDGKHEVQQPAALPTTTTAPAPRSTLQALNAATKVTEGLPLSYTGAARYYEAADSTSSRSTSSPLAATSSAAEHVKYMGGQLPPVTEDDELPIEYGEGRLEISIAAPTTSAIHWTKQTEHFPISTTIQLPTGSPKPLPRIQYEGKNAGKADPQRLAIIKEATQHAWDGYRDAAFGSDEVKPISGGKTNPFNGWGATLVDSLDTLWIMGMKEEFDEAVDAVRQIDFTTSLRSDIPLFETTIRYLGGLVAAYDVSGHLPKYEILLDKAVELAEVLYSAFDTPNRMPQTFYRWKPAFASQPHRAGNRVVLAELGSLSLEFTRLAQLTGEPKYYDAIARITDAFEEWQNSTRLPGMWPTSFDASGCAKPAQVASVLHGTSGVVGDAQRLVPGGDGEMMQAGAPVSQGNVAGPAVGEARKHLIAAQPELDEDKALRKPGVGKIIGHGDPVTEGALDGKSKEKLLAELGSSKAKRQLVDYSDLTAKERDELVTESALNSTGHQQELRAASTQDTCIPQGLASCSQYGQETFTLGGQSDSVYEYLPKQYMLLGGLVDQYKTMYEASADTAVENLIFKPMTIDNRDILIAGQLKVSYGTTGSSNNLAGASGAGSEVKRHEIFQPESEHLTCFAGGMFAMGGKLFDRPEDVVIGRKLTDGCVWAYNSTTTGIMPELFTAVECESLEEGECLWNQTRYWKELDPYEESRTRVAKVGGGGGGGVQAPKTVVKVRTETVAAAMSAASSSAATTAVDRAAAVVTSAVDRLAAVGPQVKDAVQTLAAEVLEKRQLADAAPAEPSTTPTRPIISDSVAPAQPAEPTVHYTASSRALYTPKPPLPHADFVQNKIADERLPPGFTKIGSRKYILRPEAIESVFYMYRITGEQYWRDMGWLMFQSIDQHTRAPWGAAAIDDVTKMAPEQKDSMESFWLAETLKYFYLLFDDVGTWSLDDWVLNTEAHFFRRPE